MLHVILLIFKIIGILLLAIIGLLLSLIMIVLLVPIRYSVYAEHGHELLKVDAGMHWFLHAIRARITHLEGVLHIKVKILWFTIYDNLMPKKPKRKRKLKKTDNNDNSKQKMSKTVIEKSTIIHSNKDTLVVESEKETTIKSENKIEDIKKTESILIKEKIIRDDNKQVEIARDVTTHDETITGEFSKIETNKNDASSSYHISNNTKQNELITENKINIEKIADTKIEQNKPNDNKSLRVKQIFHKVRLKFVPSENKEEKGSFFEKTITKIKTRIVRVKTFFRELKEKIISWFQTAVNFKHKFNLITDFIKDELNRQGFQATFISLKKLLKQVLPTKIKSKIVFGTGDPCSTGQALAAMSIVYSFYGDKIQIIPDFENEIFEGKHYARGRIRLVTILIVVIKLILDKRFKQLKKNFIILKEAL